MPFLRMTSCCSATRNMRRGQAPTPDPDDAPTMPALFDRSAEIEWSPVWSLRDERFKYLPTSLLYFFYRGPAAFHADSNGCAAGNTLEEAIVQGFLELVERDAYAIWWYNRLQRPEVDLGQFDDSYVRDLQTQLAETGRRLWVLDVTSDLGIPTFVAISHWMQNGQENIEFGSGAHFDARIAMLRALTELNQFLSIGLMGGGTGEKSSLDGTTPLRLQDHPYLTPSGQSGGPTGLRLEVRPSRHARAGDGLRAPRQARGPRFPRPRSDAPRHRGPGRQSDRSGIAAFLSPLRAWPALRCSGKARIARPAAVGKRAQSDSPPYLRVIPACALPEQRRGRRAAPPTVSARLSGHVTLEAHANGEIVACFDGYSVGLGTFSAGAADRAQDLRMGLPLASFASGGRNIDKEIDLLVRRLARHGLLEYRLGRSRNGEDLVVIEPQVADYWPQTPQLGNADVLVLSRFAYMRRRGNEMVLESPRAGALFKICDPKIATAHRHAVDAATNQTAPPAGRFSGGRASRPAGGLPNPFQGRRRRRQWPPTGRG